MTEQVQFFSPFSMGTKKPANWLVFRSIKQ